MATGKERVSDIIFNILGKPFGVHRTRTSTTLIDTFAKRERWMPRPMDLHQSETRLGSGETVRQTEKEIIFTRPL